MREFVVDNFIRSFFIGVVDIQFYEMAGKRNIQVTMNSELDFSKSFNRAQDMKINDIILADKENLNFKVNRDNFETQMYMTAAKGAMEAWTTRFQEKVVAEREEKIKLDNVSKEDEEKKNKDNIYLDTNSG